MAFVEYGVCACLFLVIPAWLSILVNDNDRLEYSSELDHLNYCL